MVRTGDSAIGTPTMRMAKKLMTEEGVGAERDDQAGTICAS
jgi:hypothetical protein